MSKRLGGIISCKSWQTGSPMVVTLGQQFNIDEKPTVILYTNINRHAGTPDNNKTITFLVHNKIGLQLYTLVITAVHRPSLYIAS